jgi:dTDP-4-dehydrorhamnose 3,5-epimerase
LIDIKDTALPCVKLINVKRFADPRGFFSEVYNRERLATAGLTIDFVQDNHSLSRSVGTIRGLHFQSPPFAQTKLVWVVRGRILDVAVDLRRASPTFGQHVLVELSAATGQQLLVPTGFAHGFCTLEPDTEVLYKVDAPYAPAHDFGVAFDDPDLAVAWPVPVKDAVLSDKDRRHPRLRDLPDYF